VGETTQAPYQRSPVGGGREKQADRCFVDVNGPSITAINRSADDNPVNHGNAAQKAAFSPIKNA
jgi:hypothetical protein